MKLLYLAQLRRYKQICIFPFLAKIRKFKMAAIFWERKIFLGDRHIYVFCYVAITQEVKAIITNNNTKQAIDEKLSWPNY